MTQAEIDELLRKGMTAVRRGHLEPARRLLGQVVEADPQNEMAWLWLAQAADPTQPAQKKIALEKVLELNPQNKWAAEQLTQLQPTASSTETTETAETYQEAMPEDQFGKISLELVQCPNCSAQVDIQGGAGIQTAVCGSCGTVVDLTGDQPTANGQMTRKARPEQPINPGDRAKIGDTEFQVVGWLRFKGWDDEDTWYWTEWLLASGKGDYRWLTYSDEDGFALHRPLRIERQFDLRTGFPIPQAIVNERAPAKIVALGGELTWKATIGERFNYIDASKGDKLYSVEYTPNEVELTEGISLSDTQVWQAFGRDDMVQKAAAKASARKFYRRLSYITGLFLLLGLCSIFTAYVFGREIYQETVTISTSNPEGVIGPIMIERANQPHQINTEIASLPVNNWAVVEATLYDEEDYEYYLFAEEFWDEDGYDEDGYWHENDYSGSYTFRPERAGEHYLSIEFDEATVSTVTITVTVWEGILLARYFIAFTVICGLLFLFLNARASMK